MAKVFSPLHGIKAQGKLGNSLIFQGWKGIQVVKIKTDPTNPNSTAQQAERNLYGKCVEYYRDYPITSLDKEAWRRFMKLEGFKGTEYNRYMKECCLRGNPPVYWRGCHNAYFEAMDWETLFFKVYGIDYKSLRVYYGKSPTAMNDNELLSWNSTDKYWYKYLVLEEDETYYLQCQLNDWCYTGIYKWTHIWS